MPGLDPARENGVTFLISQRFFIRLFPPLSLFCGEGLNLKYSGEVVFPFFLRGARTGKSHVASLATRKENVATVVHSTCSLALLEAHVTKSMRVLHSGAEGSWLPEGAEMVVNKICDSKQQIRNYRCYPAAANAEAILSHCGPADATMRLQPEAD